MTAKNVHCERAAQVSRLGKVYLVGAGSGDPELLTVKASRMICSADVIFYDRLVSVAIRQMFPKQTPARYVGKAKSCHSIAQQQLNRLMVDEARKGMNVCRLKGGDPFMFGRGGEEMQALRQAGITVEVVPSITSASMRQTLVFYMGLTNAAIISANLIAHGLDSATPVALIERGFTAEQRVICGTLNHLTRLIQWHQVKSPALIAIGDVVNLAEQLQWFSTIISDQPNQLTA